jgi:5-(carboxyamino)imidazole ribonucleotide mutase
LIIINYQLTLPLYRCLITAIISYLNAFEKTIQKQQCIMSELSTTNGPLVGIIMGSESDLDIMKGAAEMLRQFEVEPELTIVSAHRTPERLREYAQKAKSRGIKVIIAGAGGAAHLPGMVAANTILPVIGVPVKSSNSIDGWDSMLSILQMPYGVPVATVALNGAKNAGILAAQILALHDTSIAGKLEAYKEYQDDIVMESVKNVKSMGFRNEYDR